MRPPQAPSRSERRREGSMRELVRILLFCLIVLGGAEFLTRRAPAGVRLSILAIAWCLALLMVVTMRGD